MNILPLATIVGGELVYEKDNSQITVMLEGLPIGFDSVPILENGVTFVLAKNLFNALELEYTYNEDSNKYIVKGWNLPQEVIMFLFVWFQKHWGIRLTGIKTACLLQ